MEIILAWIYFFGILTIWVLQSHNLLNLDIKTYLSIFNASAVIVLFFVMFIDALNYIPHNFKYYLYCIGSTNSINVVPIQEAYDNFNLFFKWWPIGFLLFFIKKARRSLVYSIILAIYALIASFDETFAIHWTGNEYNPLFAHYDWKQCYFGFNIYILLLFIVIHFTTFFVYYNYKKEEQNPDMQRIIKILFIIIPFLLLFIFLVYIY
jgi:hypothetical protein